MSLDAEHWFPLLSVHATAATFGVMASAFFRLGFLSASASRGDHRALLELAELDRTAAQLVALNLLDDDPLPTTRTEDP